MGPDLPASGLQLQPSSDGSACVAAEIDGAAASQPRQQAPKGGTALAEGLAPSSRSQGGDVWPPLQERLLAVVERLKARPQVEYPPVSSRSAAVLVGLFEDRNGVVRVLLTRRSSRLKSHRGEVCLPGGKRDPCDQDDVTTALREAREELGLDPACITVLGTLPPVLSKHHLSVTPVLALIPPDLVPRPCPEEVEAAFTVPLGVFLGDLRDPWGAAATAAATSEAAVVGSQTGATPPEGDGPGRPAGRRSKRRAAAAAVGAVEVAAGQVAAISWRAWEEATSAAADEPTIGTGTGCSIRDDVAYCDAVHTFRDISWGEHKYRIHSFVYGDYDVWGLTATICISAAQLALGRHPRFQEQCDGGQHYSAFYWDGTALRLRLECSSSMSHG